MSINNLLNGPNLIPKAQQLWITIHTNNSPLRFECDNMAKDYDINLPSQRKALQCMLCTILSYTYEAQY